MAKWNATLTVDGTEMRVVALSHQERTDAVASTRCTAMLSGDPPVLSALIGKPASALVEDPERGTSRAIAGIVIEAALADLGIIDGAPAQRLEVAIAPRLHRLSLRSDCRTFQETTASDVAKKVLEGAGYGGDEITLQIGDELPARDWIVQYGETDLDFLGRLLAEEGVSLAVPVEEELDRVILFDGDRGPCTPDALRADLTGGMVSSEDFIADLQLVSAPRPGKVTMREYDFEKPRLGLEVVEEADADADFEVFEVPGRYRDEAAGKRRAKLHLEALRCGRNTITGVSSALGLTLGGTVTVHGHPYEPINAELWIRALRIEYAEARGVSRVELEAIPLGDGAPRPEPRAAAAVVHGLQSAFVTGASGQEISADENGRVTVWFPWDRIEPKDEHASLGIRALQLALGGSQLTPRVGWEVTVGFFEGDLDAPLVLNRMMNAAAPPPYPLPAGKTKFAIQTATTPGGGSVNEIRLDDAAGSEEMFINASKDASVGVGNNATDKVTVDELRTIGGDQLVEVGGGWTGKYDASQMITIGGNQAIKVATKGADESGTHTLAMGGSRSLTVGGDYKKNPSAASTLSIGGSAIDLVVGSFDTKAKATFSETVGAADIVLSSKHALHVVGARSEKAGAAKVILVAGDRAAAAASLDHKVAGAIATIARADRTEEASGDFTEVAVGAQIMQGANIVFEATDLLSVVMGASTITLTPDAIAVAGVSVTLDGTAVESGGAVIDL